LPRHSRAETAFLPSTPIALILILSCSGAPGVADSHDAAPGSEASAGDAAGTSCEGVDGGTSPRPGHLDMRITASGFGAHERHTVFLVTREDASGVLGAGNATIVDGGFTITFPKGYRRAANHEILWLVDADGDGLCTEAAGDHTGYLVAGGFDPAGSEAFTIAITDNHVRTTPRTPDLCNSVRAFADMFDFNVTGSGFAGHDGRRVHLLTRTGVNGAVFGSGVATVMGGGFSFNFPKGFEWVTYQEILWFVDEDGDGICTAAVDHLGYAVTSAFTPLENVPVTMPITDNHATRSARGADVCVVMNGCQLAP
jgi:hypothetical protein